MSSYFFNALKLFYIIYLFAFKNIKAFLHNISSHFLWHKSFSIVFAICNGFFIQKLILLKIKAHVRALKILNKSKNFK